MLHDLVMKVEQLFSCHYFSKTNTLDYQHLFPVIDGKKVRPDVLLRFGPYSVIVEVKFARNESSDSVIGDALDQIRSLLDMFEASNWAVIIFYDGSVDHLYEQIRVLEEGKLYALVIYISLLVFGTIRIPSEGLFVQRYRSSSM